MKYRALSMEELEVFSEDFKHFLIINGVHHEEWVEMNDSKKEQANQLVILFSDSVLQKVYEKIEFLEHRSENHCRVFYINNKESQLISLTLKNESSESLSTPESIHSALQNASKEISIFKTNKEIEKDRELEIHKLIEQGCVPSDKLFWNSLEKLL
tara:strand:- start:460 stop:927 length:468 start_codon:yes stop_codon:yes gene_type:complete